MPSPRLIELVARWAPRATRRGRSARWLWSQRDRRHRLMHRQAEVDRRFAAWVAGHPDAVFLQIGSHDGTYLDPLAAAIDAHPGWSGTFVEPVPDLFRQLTERRGGDDRFRLVEAAVTDRSGTVEMTVVDVAEGMPAYASALGTLHDEVLARNARRNPWMTDGCLRRITVRAITLDELVSGNERLDLLHIDTEGHDAVILAQVDLRRWRPGLILFESIHLSRRARRDTTRRLRRAGYQTCRGWFDTIAIWRGTSPGRP